MPCKGQGVLHDRSLSSLCEASQLCALCWGCATSSVQLACKDVLLVSLLLHRGHGPKKSTGSVTQIRGVCVWHVCGRTLKRWRLQTQLRSHEIPERSGNGNPKKPSILQERSVIISKEPLILQHPQNVCISSQGPRTRGYHPASCSTGRWRPS